MNIRKFKMANEIEPYIPIQRFVTSDYRNGKITRNELILYWWLRNNANPYGITSTSLEAIVADFFPDVGVNYINRLLLSLRSKRYLYYPSRQGRRGPFEVRFGHWKRPDDTYVTLDNFFEYELVRSKDENTSGPDTEASKSLDVPSQKSGHTNNLVIQSQTDISKGQGVRTSYNDKDTDNSNDLNIDSKNYQIKILTATFKPDSPDEARCLEVAQWLEEPGMDLILSCLEKFGIHKINRIFGDMKELSRTTHFENRGAYFNSLMHKD